MAQVVARLDDELTAQLDALVAEGFAASRSDAIRIGLVRLVEEQRRLRIGEAIVTAYSNTPQTDDELAGLDEATRSLVEEEPW